MNDKNSASLQREGFFSKEHIEKILLISQIFSMLAIPVLLALIGYWVQQGIQEQQIKRDYVSLAISLLIPKPKEEAKPPPELIGWAIRLLNDSSPVKLSEQEVAAIRQNGLSPSDLVLLSKGSTSLVDILNEISATHRTGGRK